MSYGLCNLPVIPLRGEPSHRSEMVSQVLFGECFEILDNEDAWLFVRLEHDGYEGWMDAKQYIKISKPVYDSFSAGVHDVIGLSSHSVCIKLGLEEMINLLPGSTLPFLNDTKFELNDQEYLFLGESSVPHVSSFHASLDETTRFYINAPYLWGGRSLFGIDCSGFSQLVYKHLGVRIFRDANQQANEGRLIDSIQDAKAGDLAFFDNEDGKITHVGIVLDDLEIIHASGRVKIDQLDDQGVFCRDTQKYTHKLKVIKRLVE